MNLRNIFSISAVVLCLSTVAGASEKPTVEDAVREIERLANNPPTSFLEAALAPNRLAKPDLKTSDVESMIRRLANQTRKLAGKNPTREQQLIALKTVMFETEGFHCPDMPAPIFEGKALEYYALPTVLRTHLAYCEGLALVFTLVGKDVGLPVSLQRAPAHVFSRVDLGGTMMNVECTDGGRAISDDELMKGSGAKPAARTSGVYFCDLTARGVLALQLNSVAYNMITHHSRHKQLTAVQWKRVASVLLKLQPNDPETLNTAATISLVNDDLHTAERLNSQTKDQVHVFGAPEVIQIHNGVSKTRSLRPSATE